MWPWCSTLRCHERPLYAAERRIRGVKVRVRLCGACAAQGLVEDRVWHVVELVQHVHI